jgi:hypothetical protein
MIYSKNIKLSTKKNKHLSIKLKTHLYQINLKFQVLQKNKNLKKNINN